MLLWLSTLLVSSELLTKRCHCCTSCSFLMHFSCKTMLSFPPPGLLCSTNRSSIAHGALLRAGQPCKGWLVSHAALPPRNAVPAHSGPVEVSGNWRR